MIGELYTNRVDLSPVEVIQASKARWEIEVFFQGIKQRMALKRLSGRDFRQVQAHIFFGCRLNVHFTSRDWLFYYEEEIILN